MKWEPWSKSDQICGRFKSSAQIGRYSVGVGATKVWRFYVSATSATNVALVWHQKGGLTRSLDDLGIMHLRCTSIAIVSCSVGVGATKVWRFYVSATSATNVALVWHQKGGLTRFLDDLGIMHLRCTSIAIPHKPQSSILSSLFELFIWKSTLDN